MMLTREQIHDLLREITCGDTSSLSTPYVNRIREILEEIAVHDATLRADLEVVTKKRDTLQQWQDEQTNIGLVLGGMASNSLKDKERIIQHWVDKDFASRTALRLANDQLDAIKQQLAQSQARVQELEAALRLRTNVAINMCHRVKELGDGMDKINCEATLAVISEQDAALTPTAEEEG